MPGQEEFDPDGQTQTSATNTHPGNVETVKKKKKHLKNKIIIAPISICNHPTSSFPDDTRVRGQVIINSSKEIIVKWDKFFRSDGAEFSISDTDHEVLQHRFKKNEQVIDEFGMYVDNHNDFLNEKLPPKRVRQPRHRTNDTSASQSTPTSTENITSEQRHQHSYEALIRRSTYRESTVPTPELQPPHDNDTDSIDSGTVRIDAQQEQDFNVLSQYENIILEGNQNDYVFRDHDGLEEFPDHLGEEAEANGDGGIHPSEEAEPNPNLGDPDPNEYEFTYAEVPENIDEDDFTFYKEPPLYWAPEEDKIRDSVPDEVFLEGAFSTFTFVSGFDEQFFKKMARVMTEYAIKDQRKTGRNTFAGSKFSQRTPFTATEIVKFLGILLKISIDGKPSGGYEQYFRETIHTLSMGKGERLNQTVFGQQPWARE